MALFVPVEAVGGFVLFWIPRFCGSVRFVLKDDKVVVVKGVWWRSVCQWYRSFSQFIAIFQ